MEKCENILDQVAKDLKAFTKEMQAMDLVHRIEREVATQKDITAFAIREGINQRQPNELIIQTLKETIRDGYKGLSIQLTKDISNF